MKKLLLALITFALATTATARLKTMDDFDEDARFSMVQHYEGTEVPLWVKAKIELSIDSVIPEDLQHKVRIIHIQKASGGGAYGWSYNDDNDYGHIK